MLETETGRISQSATVLLKNSSLSVVLVSARNGQKESLIVSALNPSDGTEEAVLTLKPCSNKSHFSAADQSLLRDTCRAAEEASTRAAAVACFESLGPGFESECNFPLSTLGFSKGCSLAALSLELESSTEQKQPESPLSIRDGMTELRGAAVFASEVELSMLSRRIPEPRVLVFFDVNHMGVANSFKLSEIVDCFIPKIPQAARRAFAASHPYELFRLGGDEFGLLIQDKGEQTSAALRSFSRACEDAKMGLFELNPGADALISRAQEFAAIRSSVRGLRAAYLKTRGGACSEYSYRLWLSQQLSSICIGNEEPAADYSVRLAAHMLKDGDVPNAASLLSLSASPLIALPQELDPPAVASALRSAQYYLSQYKGGKQDVYAMRCEPLERVIARQADTHAYERRKNAELEFSAQLLSSSEEGPGSTASQSVLLYEVCRANLTRKASRDPVLSAGVLRYNLIQDRPISDFLRCQEDLLLLKVDIARFGVVNHFSYARADELFNGVAERASQLLPDAVLVRVNGGGLFCLAPASGSRNDFGLFKKKLDHFLRYNIDEDYVRMEAEERESLEAWARQRFGEDSPWKLPAPSFKTATVEAHFINPLPTMLFSELLAPLL